MVTLSWNFRYGVGKKAGRRLSFRSLVDVLAADFRLPVQKLGIRAVRSRAVTTSTS
jgi:hypothetical protein